MNQTEKIYGRAKVKANEIENGLKENCCDK